MAQARTTSRSEGQAARIGSSARVRGRIHGDGDLLVEGQVEGDVSIRGDLTIAEGGVVTTKAVEAQSVTIGGTLEGDVSASGPVRLVSGARVRGNLRGSAVSIDEGARFSGRLDCEFELPPELSGGSRGNDRGRATARR
jgi:cytoskeletal protein CcmA (bactofilin family)